MAAKCTLAARVDACHESVTGEIGLRFKEEIEKKLDKLQVYISLLFINIRVLHHFEQSLLTLLKLFYFIGTTSSEIRKASAQTNRG